MKSVFEAMTSHQQHLKQLEQKCPLCGVKVEADDDLIKHSVICGVSMNENSTCQKTPSANPNPSKLVRQHGDGQARDASKDVIIPMTKSMEYTGMQNCDGDILSPPFNLDQMPPSSILKAAKETILNGDANYVKFPFGVVGMESLDYLLHLHDMKTKQCQYFSEKSDHISSNGHSSAKSGRAPKYLLNAPDNILALLQVNPKVVKKIRKTKSAAFLQLRCTVKGSHKLKTKDFNISADDKPPIYQETVRKINLFLNSSECLSWLESCCIGEDSEETDSSEVTSIDELFEKPPSIQFFKPSYLTLICYLKGGSTLYKKFDCDELKQNDPVAQKKIQDYLKSNEALSQALEKISPKRDEWYEVFDLPVGQKTKWYFDDYNFDVLKRVKLHGDFVRPVYHDRETTLKVSVTDNQKWGKTHRFDESYEYNDDVEPPLEKFPVVTMMIFCASKSSACKSACGSLLSEMDVGKSGGVCPSCKESLTDSKPDGCEHCHVIDSPCWMNVGDKTVCHSCYSYHRKHGYHRPAILRQKAALRNKQTISYYPHLKCNWKLKLVIYSTNLDVWKVFAHKNNELSHPTAPSQIIKRPNLSTRDRWDYQRITHKTTPKQMFLSENGESLPHVNTSDIVHHTQKQYKHRVKTVDKNASRDANFQQMVHNAPKDLGVKTKNALSKRDDGNDDDFEILHVIDSVSTEEIPCKKLKKKEKHTNSKKQRNAPMYCSQCVTSTKSSALFYSEKELHKHIEKSHEIVQPFTCPECCKESRFPTFSSRKEFNQHYELCHTKIVSLSSQSTQEKPAVNVSVNSISHPTPPVKPELPTEDVTCYVSVEEELVSVCMADE